MNNINREIGSELKRSHSAQMLNYEDYLVRTKRLLVRERFLVNMKSFLLNERLAALEHKVVEKKPHFVRTSVLIRKLSGSVSTDEIAAFLTANKTSSFEHISLSKTNKTAMIIFADRNEAIDLQSKLGELMPHLEISMARQKTTLEWRDKANKPQKTANCRLPRRKSTFNF